VIDPDCNNGYKSLGIGLQSPCRYAAANPQEALLRSGDVRRPRKVLIHRVHACKMSSNGPAHSAAIPQIRGESPSGGLRIGFRSHLGTLIATFGRAGGLEGFAAALSAHTNNDLWNLLPADPQMNREKGDSLPTSGLLKRRRDVILNYWDVIRRANPQRFEHEITRFAGNKAPDPLWCFMAMVESVEATALQRGCERWEP